MKFSGERILSLALAILISTSMASNIAVQAAMQNNGDTLSLSQGENGGVSPYSVSGNSAPLSPIGGLQALPNGLVAPNEQGGSSLSGTSGSSNTTSGSASTSVPSSVPPDTSASTPSSAPSSVSSSPANSGSSSLLTDGLNESANSEPSLTQEGHITAVPTIEGPSTAAAKNGTAGGDGTEVSPYLISKAEDFKLLAEQPTAYFKMANDIDLSGVTFSTIDTGIGFLGQLDGDNHTIKNMIINAASGDAALMSTLGIGANNVRGRVINLVFENPVINAVNGNAAVVASGSQGIIKNVHIKGGSVTATGLAGGFTANCGDTSELIECSTTASIKGAAEAGGLSGRIDSGLVSMCFIGGSVGGAAPAQGAVTGKYYTSSGNSINVKNVYWNDAVGQTVAGTIDGNAEFANTVGKVTTLPASVAVPVGGKAMVKAESTAVLPPLSYKSANDAVAQVSATGEITGKSVGEAKAQIFLGTTNALLGETNVDVSVPAQIDGWVEENGNRYYIENGQKAKGWIQIAERWYHLSETTGEQLSGFQEKTEGTQDDKGFYYYDEKGELATPGWNTINGSLRKVETNGRFTSGWATDDNNNRRYMSISGYKTVGWAEIEGKTYLFSEDGVCAQQSGGWTTYQGKRYYFVNDVLQKGWIQIEGRWYHLSETTGEQLSGFQEKTEGTQDDKGFYYYDEKGELAKPGWNTINGSLRKVETNGRFTSGWATDDNNNRRYMSISGYKTVGWAEIEGKTYLFSEDGVCAQQSGGWTTYQGKRYYFVNDVLQKGWIQITQRWYHLNETTGEQLLGFQEKTSGNPEDKGFYCYDEKGELAKPGWHMINGSLRQVETNGRFTSGWATDINGNRRYMSISGYKTVGWAEIEGKTYLFSEDGVCIGSTGWTTYQGKRYYFVNDVLQKGWAKIAERWYHLSETTGEQLSGFQEKTEGTQDDKGFYYYDEKGELAKPGWNTINGSLRKVETNGRFTSGWATDDNNNRRYMSISGYKTVGWAEIEGKTYLFSEDGVCAQQSGGWTTYQGKRYYFVNDVLQKGWIQIEGRWYHLSETTGAQLLGFQEKIVGTQEDKGFYRYDEKGELAKPGWHMINGSLRQVETNGRFTSGWATDINGNRRYMSISGFKTVGWAEIEGKTYLFSEDGVCIGSTGWTTYQGKRYYFVNDVLQKGWAKIAERWYHLSETTGEQLLGFQEKTSGNPEDKGFYCYDEKGELAKPGWHMINGSLRQVETNGRFTSGWATDINGNRRYMSISGYKTVGWAEIEGKTYLFSEDGVCIGSTGWTTYQGKRYYFVNDVLQKGWIQITQRWYHLSETTGEQLLGFQEKTSGNPEDKGFYCYDEKGELAKPGWHMINGSLRQVETNGRFTSGWATDINGNRRYMSISGYKVMGWNKIENRWYNFAEDGVQQKGWQYKTSGEEQAQYYYKDDGTLYSEGWNIILGCKRYVNANGSMYSGWKVDDEGKRRYMTASGYKVMDWNKIENRWYDFDNDGVQLMGMREKTTGEDKGWYFFNPDGTLHNHGFANIEGANRFVLANGRLATGWQSWEGYQYYFQDKGIAVTGSQLIDGKQCYFTAEGKYIAPPTINNVLYTVYANKATVNITATASPLTTIVEYSWDGGATWVNSASKEFLTGNTIPANTLRVKDAVGNITIYGSAITLDKMGPPYRGIDVSAHQGLIDWPAVKASGIDYAIIRAMTWSNSVGSYVMDPYFDYNVRNAKANGIKVGAYIYTYAFNTTEIRQEVDFFHNSREMQGLRNDNIKFDYPVYIDVEYDKMLDHANYNERTEIVRLGMILLEKYGYFPGFYSNQSWIDNYYNGRALFNEGYHFWFARYPASPVPENGTEQYINFKAQMWQYASDGRVNGINTNVDVNMCYVDYSKIIGGGGSPSKPIEPKLSVYDLNSKAVVSGSINDIIAQIVANEVGSLKNAEVYKAQAVAAYSWVLYQQQHGDAIPKVGLRPPSGEITNAVNSVSGKALYYNGAVANAAYGSASAYMTNTASAMWGLNLPYLNTPVLSPEGNWRGVNKNIPASQMQINLSKMVDAATVNATPRSQWVTNPIFNGNGYLESITVCGIPIKGGVFYENCYGLLSPNFQMSFNSNDTWTFITNGHGHCVGMSQWGAYQLAVNGYGYEQILSHYFPGTNIA